MFLHLGNNFVIPLEDIIAIIDKKTAFESKDTVDFFRTAKEEDFIKNIVDEDIKSYIITEKIEKDKKERKSIRKSIIYSSNISSSTLYKRAGLINENEL